MSPSSHVQASRNIHLLPPFLTCQESRQLSASSSLLLALIFVIAGHFVPRPVPPYCLVAKTAEQYGFTPFVISVGTSYFQRLAAVDPALKKVTSFKISGLLCLAFRNVILILTKGGAV